MQIDRSGSKPAVSGSQAAKPVSGPEKGAASAMAADSYRNTDVRVITFNTAVGNSKIKTDQQDFVTLPFYQSVINGEPGAPIMCLQEVGNAQRKELERLAKNGNFTVLSQRVALNFKQSNVILVPKRFKVERADNTYFIGSQLKAAAKTIWGWFKGEGKPSFGKLWQLVSPRGFQQMALKDTLTGKKLTVFNAHTSYDPALKAVHAKQLFDAAREAGKQGPVIVGGDLNTNTTPQSQSDKDAHAQWKDFQDMGLPGEAGDRHNIDFVLAQGFDSVSSKWYLGDSLQLPGSPNAALVSDHYAEEDVLRYKES